MSREPSLEEKIRILMSEAADDRDGDGTAPRAFARPALGPINLRTLSDRGFGRTRIFRILLSNACVFSCAYCPMRAGRRLPRHALAPARLAEVFLEARRRGWVDGLFVTSGIPKNPRWAMDRMIELVETLRLRHRYAGYIHAKAVAGAEAAQVERLALLVDRLSYNLESECQATLDRLAPGKSAGEGLGLLRRARDVARNALRRMPGDPRPPGPAMRAGATTQIVVGLDREADRGILAATTRLWRERTIHHPHFAAFRPIADTPMESHPETPALREHRLYQADFLVRLYGFAPEELPYDGSGNLPLARDPKLAWALAHPELFPVEITRAGRRELRRVPGLGPRTVERLLALRGAITGFTARDIGRLGGVASRAAGFLAFRGRRLALLHLQESLFPPERIPEPPRLYDFSPGTFR